MSENLEKVAGRKDIEKYYQDQDRAWNEQQEYLLMMSKKIGAIETATWCSPEFDMKRFLEQAAKPFVEVGGPTDQGFRIVSPRDITEAGKHFVVTNIDEGVHIYPPVERGHENDPLFAKIKISEAEMVADGRRLPFQDNSLAGMFAACMQRSTRAAILTEAARVIEPGGILVWQAPFEEDLLTSERLGLKLVAHEWDLPHNLVKNMNRPSSNDIDSVREAVVAAALQAGLPGLHETAKVPRHCIFQKAMQV